MRNLCLLVLFITKVISHDNDGFKTQKHHGYRSYVALQSPTQPIHPVHDRPRYGVWYPSTSSSVSYNPNFPNENPYPSSPTTVSFPSNNDNLYQLPQVLVQLRNRGLYNLIERAELLEELSGNRRYTIFAPTDLALRRFLNGQSEDFRKALISNQDALRSFLLNHVVPGSITSLDLIDGMKLNNVAGNTLHVIETNDGLTIAGSKILTEEGRVDFQAGNGIVHSIENVLFPFKGSFDGKAFSDDKRKKLLGIDDDDPDLEVEINPGTIRGINLGIQHRAWLGIPYAEPPLDDLRFAPPEKLEFFPEDEIYSARSQPNACPQKPDERFASFEGATKWNPNTKISEDCLYLNVHAPRNFTGKLPVLVFISGGGYSSGSANLDMYNPEQYLQKGDIIYVAMQYRVGAHGFLYLGRDSGAEGNMGILDQVMALEWIQDNIDAFGGDPDRVTLMGEYDGAASVGIHLISPSSCQLFDKAIMQSNGFAPRWGLITPDKAVNRAEILAEKLDCEINTRFVEDTVDCLREKTMDEILDQEGNVEDVYMLNLFPFVPVIDNDIIPARPEKILEEKAFSKEKDILMGSNSQAGFRSLLYLLPDLMLNEELTQNQKSLTMKEFKENVNITFSFYPKVVQSLIEYEYKRLFPYDVDGLFKALDRMAGDSDSVCNTEQFAQALSKNGNNVYRYHYAERSSRDPWPTWTGVKLGDELEFTFGIPLNNPKLYDGEEVAFAKDVVTYWINFVHNGSPNPSSILQSWPKYQAPNWQYLNISATETFVDERYLKERCQFWTEIIPGIVKMSEVNDEDFEEEDEDDLGDLGFCKS